MYQFNQKRIDIDFILYICSHVLLNLTKWDKLTALKLFQRTKTK